MATFTALNGGSPKSPKASNGGAGEEPQQQQQPRQQLTQPQPPSKGPTNSGLDPKSAAELASSQRERQEVWGTPGPDRRPLPSVSYHDIGSATTLKRKRSESLSPRRDMQRSHHPSPPHHHASPHSQASSLHHPSPPELRADRSGRQPRLSESPQKEPYRSYVDDGREHDSYLPGSGREDSAGESDGLRRTADGGEYGSNHSPEGDDRSGMYSGPYSAEQRRDGTMQSDAKKRKRNFSNRTKTGCLTCRKRKKKCDETKPECQSHVFLVRAPTLAVSYCFWGDPQHEQTSILVRAN